jgi:L-ascorbate metabolism protein UlaG (beta-lactamase superfamily)
MRITSLGQSGFILDGGGRRVVIDPFLGPLEDPSERSRFPRLVAPPVSGSGLSEVDVVLVSHHHGDHCHVATLQDVVGVSPACRFVVTPSSRDLLAAAGFPTDQLIVPPLPGWISAGELPVFVLPAKHYHFSCRQDVMFDYFGFVLDVGGRRVFYPGDTIPYAGLFSFVASLAPDVSLLPVNGRDAERDAEGIVGNLTIEECVEFVRLCGCANVIPCHVGMFERNTASVADAVTAFSTASPRTRVWTPQIGESVEL